MYGDELAQPIENFKGIYRRAKKEGLRLKAHVGEWGTAKDVRTAVEELELDEVQHGIAAVSDESVIRFLADNKIRLNITPTSNILLGRVADMSMHPIGKLYRSGVDVTINSDDVLIFDSDVSKEYLRLYGMSWHYMMRMKRYSIMQQIPYLDFIYVRRITPRRKNIWTIFQNTIL